MKQLIFPDLLFEHEMKNSTFQDLLFYDYKSISQSVKNKVVFKKNIFNFILSGHKTIQTLGKSYCLNHSQCIIIPKGNCLTTEKNSENGCFNSLTLYFDTKQIQDFFVKYSKSISQFEYTRNDTDKHIYVFDKDTFIESYIDSIKLLTERYRTIPVELAQIKFEEILLYLLHKQGTPFISFLNSLLSNEENVDFRIKMETEALSNLTLEEMAFLCNMSLSTFKRTFVNTFGVPPQKWFQKQRLQYAHEALINSTKTSSDLYLELGYSSLSSFSVAFTSVFGMPPTKVKSIK